MSPFRGALPRCSRGRSAEGEERTPSWPGASHRDGHAAPLDTGPPASSRCRCVCTHTQTCSHSVPSTRSFYGKPTVSGWPAQTSLPQKQSISETAQATPGSVDQNLQQAFSEQLNHQLTSAMSALVS